MGWWSVKAKLVLRIRAAPVSPGTYRDAGPNIKFEGNASNVSG